MIPTITHIDIRALLTSLGIEGIDHGREVYASCPNATAHDGGVDTNPSWRIVVEMDDPKYGLHFCHPCGFGGGPVSLLALVKGISHEAARRELGLVGGLDDRDDGIERQWLTWDLNGIGTGSGSGLHHHEELQLPGDGRWLSHVSQLPRHVSRYWRWKVGTDPAGCHGVVAYGCGHATTGRLRDRIIIPVHTGGRLLGYSARSIDYRGLLQDLVPGRWPDESTQDSNHSNRLDFQSQVSAWTSAIEARQRGRLSKRQHALLQDSLIWLGWLRESRDRWPGLRYLTPRETRTVVEGRVYEPEIGADMGSALMFWDLAFPPDPLRVTLVEGGLKAIRLSAAGWTNPVAIPGASGLTPGRRALLQTASHIDVVVDPDPAGRALAKQVVDQCGGRLTRVEIHDIGAPADKVSIKRLGELCPTTS